MTARRPSSTKTRRECFDAYKYTDEAGKVWLDCHICSGRIDPTRDQWEAEHTSPHAFGGTDVRPAHYGCHKKKSKSDIQKIAKGKRIRDRQHGVKRSSHPMPGSRHHPSGLRKRMNGRVERW